MTYYEIGQDLKPFSKDTILLVFNDGRANFACNYDYYKKYFRKFGAKIYDPVLTLYKVKDTSNSWVDFERAIQLKGAPAASLYGEDTFQNRLYAALDDPAFRYTGLIPSCNFYSEEGKETVIREVGIAEGLYSQDNYCKRTWVDQSKMTIKVNLEKGINVAKNNLIVTFEKQYDLENMLVSINGLFYEFDILDTYNIIFRDICYHLPIIERENNKIFDIRFEFYLWNDISLEKCPAKCNLKSTNDFIQLPKSDFVLTDSTIAIYNGCFYKIKRCGGNSNDLFRLDANLPYLYAQDVFSPSSLTLYNFHSKDPNKSIKIHKDRGCIGETEGSVKFHLPVHDGIMILNDVAHDFEILDQYNILYTGPYHGPFILDEDRSTIFNYLFYKF